MNNILFELCVEDLPANKIEDFLQDILLKFSMYCTKKNLVFTKFFVYISSCRIALLLLGATVVRIRSNIIHLNYTINRREECIKVLLDNAKSFYIVLANVQIFYFNISFFSLRKNIRLVKVITMYTLLIGYLLQEVGKEGGMFWRVGIQSFIRPVVYLNFVLNGKCLNYRFFGLCAKKLTVGNKFLHLKKYFLNVKTYTYVMESLCFVIPCFFKRFELLRRRLTVIMCKLGSSFLYNYNNSLITESSSFVEYPIVYYGEFLSTKDNLSNLIFLNTIQKKAKFFVFFCTKSIQLLSKVYYITVTNISILMRDVIYKENKDTILRHQDEIVRFIELDRKIFFIYTISKLKNIIFFEGLGTLYAKVKRFYYLSCNITYDFYIKDFLKIFYISFLSKLDSSSLLTIEYPELSGIVGKYYSLYVGIPTDIAYAIEEHCYYKIRGIEDNYPRSILGIILTIVDRIDNIVNLINIRKNSVGNDLYGLRRQALYLIYTIIENSIDIDIYDLVCRAVFCCANVSLNSILKTIIFINERIFFLYQRLGYLKEWSYFFNLGYPIRYPYDFHKKLLGNASFDSIYSSNKVNAIKKRITNLLDNNFIESQYINLFLFSFYDVKIFLFMKYTYISLKLLIENKYYLQILEVLNVFWFLLEEFLKNTFIHTPHENLRKNRLFFLQEIYNVVFLITDSKI